MDEQRREHEAERGSEGEADGRLPPRVQGRTEQVLGEVHVGAALEGLGERVGDRPRRAGSFRSLANAQRNGGFQNASVPGTAPIESPRDAAEELRTLPDEQDDDDEQAER